VSTSPCTHLESIAVTALPDPPLRCEECAKTGDQWVHLRMCLQCGKLGCCDNSPNRHASAHFTETGHSLIRSAELYETWIWCYLDEVSLYGAEILSASREP
jgi:uncharacterized UBP type Zn finger protein